MARSAKEAFKKLEALKQKRQTFDTLWQELMDYFQPNKNVITREVTPGENKYVRLYDSTGAHACELLSGALHSMLTNPASYFFEFTTGIPKLDAMDEVRADLQERAHIVHEALNGSNFQTEVHELYMDQNSIGMAGMSIEEDEEVDVRFSSKPMRGIYVDENSKGMIDVVYHCFKWKPALIIQEFGDKVPEWVMKREKEAPDEEIELLQVIEPNKDYSSAKKLSIEGKKFVSCVYIKEQNKDDGATLSESGFNTFPWVTPRWSKATGEVYGRSPAMKCLPDVKMINEMMKETIRAQQKATNPPLLVPDDGVLGSLKLYPGGLNFYRAGNGDFVKPIESGGNLQLSFEMMDDVRKRIRDCFYIDQLQLQEGPQMTATEVMQRTEEKIRLLGPLLGRQHSEFLRPLIERVYEILDKRGKFPPPPAILANRKISVKYRSMLAKAQLQSEAQNLQRAFSAAAPFLQVNPESVDVIDCDEGVRFAAKLYGLPQELMRDQQTIQAIREGRQQAHDQAMQAAETDQGVEQVAKLAPAAKIASEMQGGAARQRR